MTEGSGEQERGETLNAFQAASRGARGLCWCGHTASDHDWPSGRCDALVDVQAAAPGMEPCSCGGFATQEECDAEMRREHWELEMSGLLARMASALERLVIILDPTLTNQTREKPLEEKTNHEPFD